MALECIRKISSDFIFNCSKRPSAGLKDTLYVVNLSDIDKQATQLSPSRMRVLSLVLKSGAKLYRAQGNEDSNKASFELVKSEFSDGYKHSCSLHIFYNGEKARENIQGMINGGRFAIVTSRRDDGTQGELSYDLLGFDVGMIVSSYTYNSAENSGVASLELSSKEGQEEATPAKVFLMQNKEGKDDLAATEAFIKANLFEG